METNDGSAGTVAACDSQAVGSAVAPLVGVGLGERLSLPASDLSSGDERRVSSTGAPATRLLVVFVDQPTTTLGKQNGRVAAASLLAIADRILQLEDARVVATTSASRGEQP